MFFPIVVLERFRAIVAEKFKFIKFLLDVFVNSFAHLEFLLAIGASASVL